MNVSSSEASETICKGKVSNDCTLPMILVLRHRIPPPLTSNSFGYDLRSRTRTASSTGNTFKDKLNEQIETGFPLYAPTTSVTCHSPVTTTTITRTLPRKESSNSLTPNPRIESPESALSEHYIRLVRSAISGEHPLPPSRFNKDE